MAKQVIKRIFKNTDVYTEALKRMNWLFDEFENVVVGFSGGKDSTATFNIAMEVATERGRLPLKVLFVDQEAEWQGTIDYVKEVMYDERVEPMWFQMPMVITNNASSYERYNYCWDLEKEADWLHEKDPIAITENIYGTERFHELFEAIFAVHFPDEKACYVAGVRTEESPKRLMSLTHGLTYKDVTWGKLLNKKKQHYTFYPLYDWSYSDIWKYIFDKKVSYCKIYDFFYRHGKKVHDMRISNLHHETAIQDLLWVQEIEPKLWEKLSKRIDGADSIKQLQKNSFTAPKKLPYMFRDWEEYAMHLAKHVVQDDDNRELLMKEIEKYRKYMINDFVKVDLYRKVVDTILSSDWDFTKLTNFSTGYNFYTLKLFVDGKMTQDVLFNSRKYDKYVKGLI